MKSFREAIMFFLFVGCAAVVVIGASATLAGYWWFGLPIAFCGIWGAFAVMNEAYD